MKIFRKSFFDEPVFRINILKNVKNFLKKCKVSIFPYIIYVEGNQKCSETNEVRRFLYERNE